MKWGIVFYIVFATSALRAGNVDDLMSRLNQKLADTELYQSALRAGEERAAFCGYCHGTDGNSLRDYIPNLAQQNPRYLLGQFEFFRNGTRKDYVMAQLAKDMSVEERVNIALFYAAQKVNANATRSTLGLAQGRAHYHRACVACHGKSGHGKDELPRIAGQPVSYVETTLRSYRAKSHRRPDSPMLAVTAVLSDKEIRALAVYVSYLP